MLKASSDRRRARRVDGAKARPVPPEGGGCPACGASGSEEFFRFDRGPLFCNVTFPSAALARSAARGSIRLRVCRSCGYVYNGAFDPQLLRYAPDYENAQHFSETFRRYAGQLVGRLMRRMPLRGRRVIEIGCGDGYFLNLLCARSGARGLGFDPSYRPGKLAADQRADVTFHRDLYLPRHAREPVDLICCRHVLEHMPEPLAFLRELRAAVGRRRHVRLYFEVPNAAGILRGQPWDVLYEHCGYYLPEALRRLFARAGFRPLSVTAAYGGQFLGIFAGPAAASDPPPKPMPAGRALAEVERFQAFFQGRVRRWQQFLETLARRGQRAAFWQAGSRGVTLLNALDHAEQLVDCVVDVNPRKQGRFVAGTAHRIVAPEALLRNVPQVIVLMNAVYKAEIAASLKRLGLNVPLHVA